MCVMVKTAVFKCFDVLCFFFLLFFLVAHVLAAIYFAVEFYLIKVTVTNTSSLFILHTNYIYFSIQWFNGIIIKIIGKYSLSDPARGLVVLLRLASFFVTPP